MRNIWVQTDYSQMIMLIHKVIGMLQRSTLRMSYYDAVHEVEEAYRTKDYFPLLRKPFRFINPANHLIVEISKDQRSILFNIRDGSTLGHDCYMTSTHIAIGTTYVPARTDKSKRRQFWYNHVDGFLTSVTIFYPNLKDVSYTERDGIWQLDHNRAGIKTLPKNLGRCKKLMGQPIPFRVDVFEQLEEFLQRSGLLDLHRDLENAWPCAKCRKPKKNHRGNAINGYEPMALS